MPTIARELPKAGQKIVFTVKPIGSYVSEQTPYIVEKGTQSHVYFRNAATGSGTFDPKWAVRQSTFIIVGE